MDPRLIFLTTAYFDKKYVGLICIKNCGQNATILLWFAISSFVSNRWAMVMKLRGVLGLTERAGRHSGMISAFASIPKLGSEMLKDPVTDAELH